MDLGWIATIGTSLLSGGATGIIGVAVQRVFDHMNKKLDLEREIELGKLELQKRDKDAAILDREWQGRLNVSQVESDAKKDVAASNAFSETMWKEPARYSNAATLTPRQQWLMVGLDVVRGIVRPGLTVYLCYLTTRVWQQVQAIVGKAQIEHLAALEVWKLVVGTILYLTTTVVLWWFGTRNKQKQPAI